MVNVVPEFSIESTIILPLCCSIYFFTANLHNYSFFYVGEDAQELVKPSREEPHILYLVYPLQVGFAVGNTLISNVESNSILMMIVREI